MDTLASLFRIEDSFARIRKSGERMVGPIPLAQTTAEEQKGFVDTITDLANDNVILLDIMKDAPVEFFVERGGVNLAATLSLSPALGTGLGGRGAGIRALPSRIYFTYGAIHEDITKNIQMSGVELWRDGVTQELRVINGLAILGNLTVDILSDELTLLMETDGGVDLMPELDVLRRGHTLVPEDPDVSEAEDDEENLIVLDDPMVNTIVWRWVVANQTAARLFVPADLVQLTNTRSLLERGLGFKIVRVVYELEDGGKYSRLYYTRAAAPLPRLDDFIWKAVEWEFLPGVTHTMSSYVPVAPNTAEDIARASPTWAAWFVQSSTRVRLLWLAATTGVAWVPTDGSVTAYLTSKNIAPDDSSIESWETTVRSEGVPIMRLITETEGWSSELLAAVPDPRWDQRADLPGSCFAWWGLIACLVRDLEEEKNINGQWIPFNNRYPHRSKEKNISHRAHWMMNYFIRGTGGNRDELTMPANIVCFEAHTMELLTLLTRGKATKRLPLDLPQGSPVASEDRYFDSVFLALPRALGEAQRPVQGAMPYVTVAARARNITNKDRGPMFAQTHLVVDRPTDKGVHGNGSVQARVLETQLMLAFALNARAFSIRVPVRYMKGGNAEEDGEDGEPRLLPGDRVMICRLGFVRRVTMSTALGDRDTGEQKQDAPDIWLDVQLFLAAASYEECVYQAFGAQRLPSGPATFDSVLYANDAQKERLFDSLPPQVTQEPIPNTSRRFWTTVSPGDQTTLRYVSKLRTLCAGCQRSGTALVSDVQYLRLTSSDPRTSDPHIHVTAVNELRLPTSIWVLAYLEGPDIMVAGLRSLLPEAVARANLAGKGLAVRLPITEAKEALAVYPDLNDIFIVVDTSGDSAEHRSFQIWLLPFPGEGFRLETPRNMFARSAFGSHFTRLTAMQEGHLVSSEVLSRYRAQLESKLEAVRTEHDRLEGRGEQGISVENLALAEDFITKHDFSCANAASVKEAGTHSQCWRKGLCMGWILGKRSMAADRGEKLAIMSCAGAFKSLSRGGAMMNDGTRMHGSLSDGLYVRPEIEMTPSEGSEYSQE
jgi:hypothetical protein